MDVMNITRTAAVDVSSFLLFEVTGDSESSGAVAGESSVPLDEDDAESCSCDLADQYTWIDSDHSMNGDEESEIDSEFWGDGFDDDEDETTSDPVYRKWSGNGEIGTPKVGHKSSVPVDSTTKEFESLNEMEKNRLFWEACLAS